MSFVIPKHLDTVITVGVNLIKPYKVYLYGSRARNDFNSSSDFDLAFFVDDNSTQPHSVHWGEFLLWLESSPPTLYSYDVSCSNELPIFLINKILSEGVLVYERGK
jgi:predicted nucleotidyltransferase